MTEAKRLFDDMDAHLLGDGRPSLYFRELRDPVFLTEHPFTMLSRLKDVGQSPRYHPEGSVWNHTLLVLDEAAARRGDSRDARAFMWAALLHDVGKAETTREKKGKITAYDHDKAGARLAREFLGQFEAEPFVSRVAALVRWHMQVLYAAKDPRFADFAAMARETDVREVAMLGLCDRLGRGGVDRRAEERNITEFLRKAGHNGIHMERI